MIEQFIHTATTSFFLWFDNRLLSKGRAFYNKTGTLVNYTDPRADYRYKPFGSKYKQWVNDSSISGATIPTEVSVNGILQNRASGVIFDFDNGRIMSSGISPSAVVTSSFAVKEFNVYFTNDTEEELLLGKSLTLNSRVKTPTGAYAIPYEQAVPAIFLSSSSMKNDPFAFGGEDTTKILMKAIILAETSYQLEGALSLFADSEQMTIPTIPFTGSPITEFGDVKSGVYSYTGLCAQYVSSIPFFVNNVDTSKLTDKASKAITNGLHVGFIDFELHQQRSPRS